MVPLGNGTFKAGATYEWDELNEIPTEKGLNQLLQKIENLIDLPFEVLYQQAGIRPTTNDRNPIIGRINGYKNLFVLNGLGTKGVVRAPWLAETLLNCMEKGAAIPHEVSIDRIQLKN